MKLKTVIFLLILIVVGSMVFMYNQVSTVNDKLTVNTPLLNKLLDLNAVYNLLPTVVADYIDPSYNAAKSEYNIIDISLGPVVVKVEQAQLIQTDTRIHDASMSTVRYTGCQAAVLQSNDYATVITADMINCLNPPAAPAPVDNSLPYRWQHESSNKCIVPNTLSNGQIIMKFQTDCPDEDNAKYKFMANGQIQHIASGKYLHTWNNQDLPVEGEALTINDDSLFSNKVSFEFLPTGQIRHKSSQKCIHPYSGGENPSTSSYLSLKSDCADSNNAIKFKKI